jgi:hypothetical protein
MTVGALVLMATLSGAALPTDAVQHFPGGYFETRVYERFQRSVLASWPGPFELLRMWRDTELSEKERVALLVGGAAFHDPVLMPAYREALSSDSQLLRQAAIYGYRNLIADRRVSVDITIDDRVAEAIGSEIRGMQRILERHSLVEVWLQSLLAHEGLALPGYEGIRLKRPPTDCMNAVDRLADIGDLDLLVTAFELSSDTSNQIGMLEIIDGLSLSRFISVPTGAKPTWGVERYEIGIEYFRTAVENWQNKGCRVDGEAVLRGNLRSLGAEVDDPLSAEACTVWLGILRGEVPKWWATAARRLYACGGPKYELSALNANSQANRARRDRLVSWYRSGKKGRPSSRR